MKRADDVFFFTLIDFLLQMFFFGLLLYVLNETRQADLERQRQVQESKVRAAMTAAGVSDLTELTDALTKLAPLQELRGMADFISGAGGLEKAKESVKVVADAGGASEVNDRLVRLQKLEQGTGKPPCVFDIVNGKRTPRSVARIEVTDTHVIFHEPYNDLDQVLQRVGVTYQEVQNLPLAEFRSRFVKLRSVECDYRLDVNVSTQLLAPMDAVWSAFRTNRV